MDRSEYITIPQLAEILGLSRATVYRRVKKGQIKAVRIGRNYAIERKNLGGILNPSMAEEDRKQIDRAVDMVFAEYGDVLSLLGRASVRK